MLHRLLRLALPVAAGIALLAAVAAEFGQLRETAGLGMLALAVALTAIHLRLDKLEKRMALVARQGRQRGAEQERLAALFDRNRDVVRRQGERVRRDLAGVRRHLDQLPSDTAYLQRLVAKTADPEAPLPALGGWAATARSILALVDEIERAPGPVTVLDCGSGSSTVLEALLLKHRGAGGHVYALDADPGFAEETRGYLRAHGVEQFGAVVDAPLVDVTLPDGSTAPWYDLSGLPDIGEIDILFVDGPIGTIADEARFPAFPLLADRLADGALVVLDDTNRPAEKRIVRRWLEEEYAGRRLTQARTHGRATLLRVSRTS
ncbi:class I SAM-dependent methyltransferase [Nocardioides sp.]|uniref:class I SAM-dependent methyltransferase n=1 Tax=Nocardioides sp. TaxID=35761 RepID=UPI003528A5A7